jgi:capsular polysaccharide export protein
MKVVILQGPVGGFFRFLKRALVQRGFQVVRVNFNGGDALFSIGDDGAHYRDGLAAWEGSFERILRNERPNAVVLFGDERPIHRIARRVAKSFGIPVWCFEEGYLRPNYVTFERDGNNANSPLPRHPEEYDVAPDVAPPPQLGSQFVRMATAAVGYFMALRLGRALYPGYQHHRDRPIVSEIRYWTRSAYRKAMHAVPDRVAAKHLTGFRRDGFFLVALQVHDDLQLRRHGRGWTSKLFIDEVLQSFARSAGPTDHLVFKVHPLDRGHTHTLKRVSRGAARLGLSRRVTVLQSGSLAPLVRASRGLITINSTSGVTAIEAGVPTLVLGDTFYRVPGLATSADDPHEMDSFWTSPPKPDAALAERFVARIRADALLPGSFYDPTTWDLLCDHVARRVRSAMPAPARPLPQLVTVPWIPRPAAPAAPEPAVARPAWRPSFLPVLPRPGLDPAE